MILGKVKIQNFKSIKNSGWIFLSKGDLVTILAGQNESGKTSFLRALRFFEEGAYSTFEEDDERLESFPRVDLVFYLTDAEYEQLKSDTSKEIADYFKKEGFWFVRGDTEASEYESIKWVYPEQIKKVVTDYNEGLDESVEHFKPFPYFEKLRPEMIFYSSFNDNILPGKALYADVISNQAIQDFEKVYNVDFQNLMDPSTSDQKRTKATEEIKKRAEDSLNSYWHQKISGEEADYKYRIQIVPQPDQVSSYINFYVDQGDGMPLRVSQKSQGFQWFSGFVLRLRAHESALKKSGLILLIDEPGQGLHEVAQQDVKDVIEEVSNESRIQVIYSTHQPILLGRDKVNFSRLLLVDRTNEDGSKFRTISQLVSANGAMDALAPVRSAIGMVTLTDPIKKQMSVIVEGITEYFYIKTILGDKYTVIPSAGVDQVPNIFAILYGWGINAKALVDDDSQGRRAYSKIKKEFFDDKESDDLKKTLLKVKDSTGIEELLGIEDISSVVEDFGFKYDKKKSKTDNVKAIGKFIFAKAFFDKYLGDTSSLSREARDNFKLIEDFLNQS